MGLKEGLDDNTQELERIYGLGFPKLVVLLSSGVPILRTMEYWGRYRGQWDANFQQLSYLLLTWGHVQQGPESEKTAICNPLRLRVPTWQTFPLLCVEFFRDNLRAKALSAPVRVLGTNWLSSRTQALISTTPVAEN